MSKDRSDHTRIERLSQSAKSGGVGGVVSGDGEAARTTVKFSDIALSEDTRQRHAFYTLTDRLYHAQSLDDVYASALEAIRNSLKCDRASILLFDNANVMRFVASTGLSEGYRRAVDGHSPWTPDERRATPICIDDFTTADMSPALRRTILSEGIGAAAFIPLLADGTLIGKFMTYFNKPHAFSDE